MKKAALFTSAHRNVICKNQTLSTLTSGDNYECKNNMRKIIYILLIYFSLNVSLATTTVYDDALLMLKECTMEGETRIEQFKITYCLGYVTGLIDTYNVMSLYTKNRVLCLPKKGIEVGQALIILGEYLLVSNQKISTGRNELFLSLLNKFPCA